MCTQESALQIINEQIAAAKTLEDMQYQENLRRMFRCRLCSSEPWSRAQRALTSPADEQDYYSELSALGHVAEAITLIQPVLNAQAADLAVQLAQMQSQLLNTLSPDLQIALSAGEKANTYPDPQTLVERVAAIEKQANAEKRDELLVTLVLNAGPAEPLDNVSEAASTSMN